MCVFTKLFTDPAKQPGTVATRQGGPLTWHPETVTVSVLGLLRGLRRPSRRDPKRSSPKLVTARQYSLCRGSKSERQWQGTCREGMFTTLSARIPPPRSCPEI